MKMGIGTKPEELTCKICSHRTLNEKAEAKKEFLALCTEFRLLSLVRKRQMSSFEMNFSKLALCVKSWGPTTQYGRPISFEGLLSSIVGMSTKVDNFIRAVAALATPDITNHSET
jgi:hypothetical protein